MNKKIMDTVMDNSIQYKYNMSPKHLDHDYELEHRPVGLLSHLWDTIEVLGGWKGLLLIGVCIIIFHYIVLYVITTGRIKRDAESRRKKK